jgi:hypothetical protein
VRAIRLALEAKSLLARRTDFQRRHERRRGLTTEYALDPTDDALEEDTDAEIDKPCVQATLPNRDLVVRARDEDDP